MSQAICSQVRVDFNLLGQSFPCLFLSFLLSESSQSCVHALFSLVFLSSSFWFCLCFCVTIFNIAAPVIQYSVKTFLLTGPAGLSFLGSGARSANEQTLVGLPIYKKLYLESNLHAKERKSKPLQVRPHFFL